MRRRDPWSGILAAPYLPIAAYLAFVGWTGLAHGGITPARLLDHTLPAWLVVMWTIAVAAGGTLAVLGGLTKRTRIESSGLVLLLYGAVVYGVVGGWAVHGAPWNIALLSAGIAAMCGIRMRVLSRARQAVEVAAGLDGEGRE